MRVCSASGPFVGGHRAGFQKIRYRGQGVGPGVYGGAAGQQSAGIGVLRTVQHVLGGAGLHGNPFPQNAHAVRNALDHAQVVGDEQDGRAVLLLKLLNEFQYFLLHVGVQGGGGLVAHQKRRLASHGQSNHHALALAAAELVGVALGQFLGLGKLHLIQPFHRSFSRLFSRHTKGNPKGFCYLFAAAHGGVERRHGFLEHHGHARSVEGELVPRHLGLRRQEVHQRQSSGAFSGAGLPHQGQGFAAGDFQVEVGQCRFVGEGNPQSANGNYRVTHSSSKRIRARGWSPRAGPWWWPSRTKTASLLGTETIHWPRWPR